MDNNMITIVYSIKAAGGTVVVRTYTVSNNNDYNRCIDLIHRNKEYKLINVL